MLRGWRQAFAVGVSIATVVAMAGCGSQKTTTAPSTKAKASSSTGSTSGQAGSSGLKKLHLRLPYTVGPGSEIDYAAHQFKKDVEAASNGKITVTLYPSGQLGTDEAVMKEIQAGTVPMTAVSSVVPGLFPKFGVFELPYLFTSRVAVAKIAKSQLLQQMFNSMNSKNIQGLALWENGFRQITNNVRPIVKPSDLKGLKMRTPSDPLRVKIFDTYGANASALPYKELYSALQQHTFDGQENPLANIESDKMYEVQKYLSISNHVYSPAYLIASLTWWKTVPSADKKVILTAGNQAGDAVRAYGKKVDGQLVSKLQSQGMKVNKVDVQAFIKASQPIYQYEKQKLGSIVDQVLKIAHGQ